MVTFHSYVSHYQRVSIGYLGLSENLGHGTPRNCWEKIWQPWALGAGPCLDQPNLVVMFTTIQSLEMDGHGVSNLSSSQTPWSQTIVSPLISIQKWLGIWIATASKQINSSKFKTISRLLAALISQTMSNFKQLSPSAALFASRCSIPERRLWQTLAARILWRLKPSPPGFRENPLNGLT